MSFIVWAVSKCNATQLMYQQQAGIEEEETIEETATADGETGDSSIANNPQLSGNELATDRTTNNPTVSNNTTSSTLSSPSTQAAGSILYVTIDGLNLRTAPHLDSAVIRQLKLFEEVIFMNEVTDSTQLISLGQEMANEPWVKVKHQRGFVGWVYGAGVNYYKKKRSGVQ